MRKFLSAMLMLLFVQSIYAQTYNNEWIDYSKTYYKFKVGATGLQRIPKSTLQAAGLGAANAETFQLFRNGQQVPLYTTVATGAMGASDFIEFWGEMNDGKADNPFYNTASLQLTDKWSLVSDTATYYLTTNATVAQNLRYTVTNNTGASGGLPVEPWFMHTAATHYKNMINPGFAAVVGENLHASSYDRGEGWSSPEIYPGSPLTDNFANLFPEPTGPDATYCFGAAGNALNSRVVQVSLNGSQIVNQVLDYFDANKFCVNVPIASIAGGSAAIVINNNNGNGNDRMVVMFHQLTYPRKFNFGGQSQFEFQLPANAAGNYLEIANFNGGAAPVLYDITNRRRYAAVSSGGLLRFALLPSAEARRLVLVSTDNGAFSQVPALTQRNFTNLMAVANQGDYLILSSKMLHTAGDPNNVVEQYKTYRSSLAGGGYNTRIIDVEDLYEQYSFGISQHPLALRNYLRQARNAFVAAPKFVLLIGRGSSYNEARMNQGQPYQELLNMVPTFGYPASDNLLTAEPGTSLQTTPIGRLGAVYPTEVSAYLEKVKEYELAQANNNFTIGNKAWMKNFTFVAGSSEPFLQPIIDNYQQSYMSSTEDTLVGGKTFLFTKTQAGGVTPLNNAVMDQLWSGGHSMLSYFGHSSASTLEFNLDDPYSYNNPGKYPMMVINGCNSGNYYVYNPFRITTNNNATLSEKFVFANQRGSIGFVASTHFGVVNYLHYYNQSLFKALTTYDYGQPIGKIMKDASQGMFNITGPSDFYAKMHAEEICLHGDPAIKLNTAYPKHDYVIEDQTVKINPSFISIAEPGFRAELRYMNLGMAQNDSITIEVKRQYPAGNTVVAYRKRVSAAHYQDTMSFSFTISPLTDKGLNRLIFKVDADNEIDEMSEINNTVTKEFFIYEDEARPVFPHNFGIVTALPQKLYASTANPLALPITYNMEMDTTEKFNSPGKITRSITQSGGLLEFDPGTLVNNTVYYWRVAPAPSGTAQPNWNTSSFVYLSGSSAGYNQSHLYQNFKSGYERLKLDSLSRRFNFDSIFQNLVVRNGVWPTAAWEEGQLIISVNQDPYIRSFCGGDRIAVNVFDPINGSPWLNPTVGGVGMFNSLPSDCAPGRQYNFEFSYADIADRNKAMNMLRNNIPDGHYVVLRNITFQWTDPAWLVNTWKTDAAANGNGQSLYNTLKSIGFAVIDSFYDARSWTFIYRKGMPSFAPRWSMSEGLWDRVNYGTDIKIPDTLGYITSPAFGPARAWQEVHWRGTSFDAQPGDKPELTVVGITPAGVETPLYTLDASQQDFNISAVSATQYPNIRLRMKNQDSVNGTPWQLGYWRVNYTPIPEGAVAPNITLQIKDTLDAGEPLQVKLAFKNISSGTFTDSIKVRMILTDQFNVPDTFAVPRQKKLAPGEVLTIDYTIPTASYTGINTLFVDVNPDNDQPEQFHYNNFVYKNFFVKPDGYNPLLDVTFDGTHILNKDIVSARPQITIKLKDESRFLALDDTSLVSVQVRYPSAQPGVLRSWDWNTDTLKFTPANLASGENTATIDFSPYFTEDGTYELIVKGKDKSGNTAGDLEYRVLFQVINKPMISNLLNYPNPFTSSTAFVFTVTGREVPQNIKIQILTITGKIVREITKSELGPIRIGRNITEFKWDGTDQYGSKLANGVYLYHVVTNLNGKELEHYKVGKDDKTDQYFNKGYGKMVLIR